MKKPAPVRSLLYSGDLLAVDLGSFAVKVLSMKAKERSLTVLGTAVREVWRELAAAETEDEKGEIYAGVLREIMAEHGFKPRSASISLSGNTVILRFLALPQGYRPDPEAGLPGEARALVPFDEPDTIVSPRVLDPVKGFQPRHEMMLTVAQRKTVQAGMDVARKAGLRPAVIINDALALAGAFEFFEGKKGGETTILVNLGATSTSVCVMEAGAPRAARVVNIAGNAFTRAVKREFDIPLEEAERLKVEHGLSAPVGATAEDEAIAARVARAIKPAVKDLAVEILRTIDVFLERRPGDYPHIKRLVLAGGSSALKGLPERLSADTGLETSLFRPMVNTVLKDGTLGISPLASPLAAPCGLALSNTLLRRSDQPRVNLVPRRARRAAIIRDVTPGFWRLIAGPAIVVAALSLYAVWAVNVSHREQEMELELEVAAAKEKAAQLQFTKKKPPVAQAKRVADPYAFLGRLEISGVFGNGGSSLVMLNGDGGVFTARGGRLYDSNEEIVRGVSSEIRNNSLALDAGGRRYSIEIPK